MEDKLDLKEFQWDNLSIQRFWNTMYQFPHAIGIAGAHGQDMIRIINKIFHIENKKILDFGVAHGYLIEVLLKSTQKAKIGGYDYSETAVRVTNERFKKEKRFIKAFSPANVKEAHNTFDIVLATEVLEHLTDNNIVDAFAIIRSMLKKNGCLIVTVPNNEDLDSKKVFCPACGNIFHPVQHQRSFNSEGLISLLRDHGFLPMKMKPVSFFNTKGFYTFSKKVFLKLYPKKNTNILGVFIKNI